MSGDRGPSLRLRAPAKVNWTLEVLRARPDGYHEVRTVLQTIALSDRLTLIPADGLSLELSGDLTGLGGEPPESNLAYRAAALLRAHAPAAVGARIVLEKAVPVATGLGGGSSDAAAVLRGLRTLWKLPLADGALAELAAQLGADVAFFLNGGTALASGRGEQLTSLPDVPRRRLVLAWPRARAPAAKTARMYDALGAEHHTDGARTERLVARLRAGEALDDGDLWNAFEQVLPDIDSASARAFEQVAAFGQPHLAGSGPALFALLRQNDRAEPLLEALRRLDLHAVETQTLPADEALACEEA